MLSVLATVWLFPRYRSFLRVYFFRYHARQHEAKVEKELKVSPSTQQEREEDEEEEEQDDED